MNFNYRTVREFVLASIEERKIKNPRYTTSAFAQRVGLSAAMLTEILKGRKFLSKERCYGVARELKLTESETEYLGLLAEFETAKDSDLKHSLARRIQILNAETLRDTDEEHFSLGALPVSPEGLRKIRELTQRYLNEVTEISKSTTESDRFYEIDVQFTRISQPNQRLENRLDVETLSDGRDSLAAQESSENSRRADLI